jgi:hypothetical protein
VRPFKGIFCDDISEFESYHPSHAVVSNSGAQQIGLPPAAQRVLPRASADPSLRPKAGEQPAKVQAVFVFAIAAYNLVRIPKLLAAPTTPARQSGLHQLNMRMPNAVLSWGTTPPARQEPAIRVQLAPSRL